MTDLDIEEYSISLPAKSFEFFSSMFRVIIHLHSEVPSCQFCSIWQSVSRQYSPIPIRIHLAVTSSINLSEPVPLAGPCHNTGCQMVQIISCSFPSPDFSLAILLTCTFLFLNITNDLQLVANPPYSHP